MKRLTYLTLCLAATFPLLGCGDNAAPTTPPASTTTTETAPPAAHDDHGHDEHEHSHGDAPHGGTLADWGGGKLHVEFTVDHDKKETVVYVLGEDAKTPNPIKADSKLQLVIDEPESTIELTAQPDTGDPEGTASRFVGQHDTLGIVREFSGVITGEVDGTPYTGKFKEEAHDHK